MKTVAWLLNLDAELELADPDRPAASSRLRAQVDAHGSRFLAIVEASGRSAGYDHVRAASCETWDHLLAWCPTPGVISGSSDSRHPDLACLQRVNHRGFLIDLTDGLPDSTFVRSVEELLEHLQSVPTPARGWLLKRAFGFSGRWRKRLGSPLDEASRRWCEASMQGYGEGLQVEPLVSILEEYTLHGLLGVDGSVRRGDPTRLHSDSDGAWVGNETIDEGLSEEEDRAFALAFSNAATALHDAGYAGPFAIDGFRWRDAEGRRRWHSLSDLNARFTMGYFVGMHRHHREVVEACDLAGFRG